jgi:hypothetical protein
MNEPKGRVWPGLPREPKDRGADWTVFVPEPTPFVPPNPP